MRNATLLLSFALLALVGAAPSAAEAAPFDADVGLDPGHSYVDVGAVGSGLREFELNLETALRAKALLESRGYSVRLTHSDNNPVSAMNHPDWVELIRIEQEAR